MPISYFDVGDARATSDRGAEPSHSTPSGDADLAAILEAIVTMDAPMRALLNRRRPQA